jgi:hypothetical protein
MKILIISDSLGLPRESPEVLAYEETWCYRLKSVAECHQCSIGGGTIDQLSSQLNYLKMYKPDLVIVQSGIVDCCPRALSKTENYLINKYWISRKIMGWSSKRILKLLRKRGKTYTNKKEFKKHIQVFNRKFGEAVFWVSIVEGNEEYEKKVPGVSKKILEYNDIISEENNGRVISLKGISTDFVMSDLHHLNSKGHQFLFNEVRKIIQTKEENIDEKIS